MASVIARQISMVIATGSGVNCHFARITCVTTAHPAKLPMTAARAAVTAPSSPNSIR